MARHSNTSATTLIIDRAAAAERPTAQAVSEWASEKRVFISSVMSELEDERLAAAKAIRHIGARPVMFEDFGGRDADPEQAYLAELESSDIYLGILGRTYGKPLPTRFSATHTEYLHAEKSGLRVAVWAIDTDDREGHEESFLNEVRTYYVAQKVRSAAELESQILDRLALIAAEDLAPWCKLQNTIFRSSEVTNRGDEIEIAARVRDDTVTHSLERMRPDRMNNGAEGRLTWQGRSREVRVNSVETTMTAARSTKIRMNLTVLPSSHNSMFDVSFNGITPNDLTDAAIRSSLFGEPTSLDRDHMGFLVQMPDPFEPLRNHAVSEETLRPIAELLLTDNLVGEGRAERLVSFRLGLPIRGQRKCQIEYETRKRYSNEQTQIRTVEGLVKL